MLDQLHQRSLESEEFGRKAARAVGCVSQLEVSGVKLRDVLLRNIQTDFKREFHFIFFFLCRQMHQFYLPVQHLPSQLSLMVKEN